MEKACTYRDFLIECENYNHSKEHYEIMKESAELMLMEQFVENQEFAKENTIEFTEGYLMEAADADSVNAASEAIDKKGQGLVKKIFSKIATVFKRFAAWIKKLFEKIASKFKKKRDTITDEEINELCATFTEVVRKWADDGIYILDKKGNTIVPSDKDKVNNYLLNILKSEKMYVKGVKNVVSYQSIVDICNKAIRYKRAEAFDEANKQLKNEIGKPFEIDLNGKLNLSSLESLLEDFKENQYDEEIKKLYDVRSAMEEVYNEIIQKMTALQETLNVVIPATSKFYAEIADGISKIIDPINEKIKANIVANNKGDN